LQTRYDLETEKDRLVDRLDEEVKVLLNKQTFLSQKLVNLS
jgi:hypothetical protein